MHDGDSVDVSEVKSEHNPAEDLAEIAPLLTPNGRRFLDELCRAALKKNSLVTRAHMAELLDIPETSVLKLVRDVRTSVLRKGYRLRTVTGSGGYELIRP